MISDLDVLRFSELKDQYPDRYEKADLAGTSAVEERPGEWIVNRPESEDSHVVQLVQSVGHAVGACSCDGYAYNDLPCSHLSAVWRMESKDLLEIPTARLRSVDVEVPGEDRRLSTAVDEATKGESALTDGGGRL